MAVTHDFDATTAWADLLANVSLETGTQSVYVENACEGTATPFLRCALSQPLATAREHRLKPVER